MADDDGDGPLGMDATTMIAMGGFIFGFAFIVVILTWGVGGVPILAYICVPTGIVPGSIALAWGLLLRRKEQSLKAFAEWLGTKRRIPMNELAADLGKNRMETETMLGRALKRGLVKGVVDRSTDEWVSQEAVAQQLFVERCPRCGGNVQRWVLPEERAVCPYCGEAFLAATPPAGPSA